VIQTIKAALQQETGLRWYSVGGGEGSYLLASTNYPKVPMIEIRFNPQRCFSEEDDDA
jgi:hypothetical protein